MNVVQMVSNVQTSFSEVNLNGGLNHSVELKKNQKAETGLKKMVFNKLEDVNKYQFDVIELEKQIISDPDSVDPHDVTIAMVKAEQSLQLTKNIIDRLCGAWKEITTPMP